MNIHNRIIASLYYTVLVVGVLILAAIALAGGIFLIVVTAHEIVFVWQAFMSLWA